MKQIDARKLACPAPVLAARDALETEHPEVIQILVG
ncbi:MAG: sulfurtransferase TusA family protein [Desulfobacterales bacterium]